jgi:hypothetical protein
VTVGGGALYRLGPKHVCVPYAAKLHNFGIAQRENMIPAMFGEYGDLVDVSSWSAKAYWKWT